MKNLDENNLIRFISISKKKGGLFANFKVKGIRGGAIISASISVDVSAAEVNLGDPLEKIVESCAVIADKEFKKANVQFEGIAFV